MAAESQDVGIDISWERDDEHVSIAVSYGDAMIEMLSTSEEGGKQLETLVNGLPQIIHQIQISMAESGSL